MKTFYEGLQSLTPEQVEKGLERFKQKLDTPDGHFTEGLADNYIGLIALGIAIEAEMAKDRHRRRNTEIAENTVAMCVGVLIEVAEEESMLEMFPDTDQ